MGAMRSALTKPPLAVGAVLGLPTIAFAQSLGHADDVGVPWWRVAGALILCLGLAVGAAYALRSRLGGGGRRLFEVGPRKLRLVETLRLSHQVDVCLVQCDQGQVLIAATPHGAVVVSPDQFLSEQTPTT